MKTKKQLAREKRHNKVIEEFNKLFNPDSEASQMAMWSVLERKTGYERISIQRILKANGIDYTKQKTNDNNESN